MAAAKRHDIATAGRAIGRNGLGRFLIRGGLACALAAGLGACATQRYPELSIDSANRDLGGGYRLGAGDKVRVTVFDEPTLTGEYEVSVGGSIALPLLNDVPALNSTTDRLAGAITSRLAAGGYVLNPKVAVEVVNYRPFYILGEVNKPGEYAYMGQLSVMQAIAKAGGFTPRANRGVVVVRRNGWATPREARLAEEPLLVAPGDTVEVREAFF